MAPDVGGLYPLSSSQRMRNRGAEYPIRSTKSDTVWKLGRGVPPRIRAALLALETARGPPRDHSTGDRSSVERASSRSGVETWAC